MDRPDPDDARISSDRDRSQDFQEATADVPSDYAAEIGATRSQPSDDFTKYLPLLLPIFPFVIAMFRVSGASAGDSSVRAALLATLDIRTIVLEVIIDQLGLILVIIAYYLYRVTRRSAGEIRQFLQLLVLMCSIGGAFLLPLVFHGAAVSALGVSAIIRSMKRRSRHRKERADSGIAKVGATLAISIVVSALTLTQIAGGSMWLPPETIATKDSAPRVAYVLKVEDGDLTVLYHRTARVEILRGENIRIREICSSSKPGLYLTIFDVLTSANNERNVECPFSD